jgi:hypothetical protein
MKHPVTGDFDTAVTEAGVNVTFKPTNSIYSFYRLAESEDVARLGPVSLEPVRHAGPSGDTEDYLLMKFKTWRSSCGHLEMALSACGECRDVRPASLH